MRAGHRRSTRVCVGLRFVVLPAARCYPRVAAQIHRIKPGCDDGDEHFIAEFHGISVDKPEDNLRISRGFLDYLHRLIQFMHHEIGG